MSKKSEKVAVFRLLEQTSQAISLSDLLELLGPNFAERTVRRWLNEMANTGLIIKQGQKRGTKYCIEQTKVDTQNTFQFSKKSLESIKKIQRPLFERTPTTYNEKLLTNYKPNITFYLNEKTRNMLYQAGNKNSIQMPADTYTEKIYNRLLIDLSYNSSRLEENTYTLLDTKRLVLEGKNAEDKLNEETIMILNHKEAIAYLIKSAKDPKIDTNKIYTLHYLLSDALIANEYTGKPKNYGVRISGSTYTPWEKTNRLVEKLKQILEKTTGILIPKNDQKNFIEDIYEDLKEMSPERITGLGITTTQLNYWLKNFN